MSDTVKAEIVSENTTTKTYEFISHDTGSVWETSKKDKALPKEIVAHLQSIPQGEEATILFNDTRVRLVRMEKSAGGWKSPDKGLNQFAGKTVLLSIPK